MKNKEYFELNQILGYPPKLNNSRINWGGDNNVLYCEQKVQLIDSVQNFNGNGALIYLCGSDYDYKLLVNAHNNTVFHMGKDNYITQRMTIVLSEQKHCFIGDEGIFSWGIFIRNADPHLIYECRSRERINPTQSVYIGDHVWLGADSYVLKGTMIDSGSIIGAKSVISGKHIKHNSLWAGNPARKKKDGVFWDKACVNFWEESMTETSVVYDTFIHRNHIEICPEKWIYKYSSNEEISFLEVEAELNKNKSAQDNCEYLKYLNAQKTNNRFVHRTKAWRFK